MTTEILRNLTYNQSSSSSDELPNLTVSRLDELPNLTVSRLDYSSFRSFRLNLDEVGCVIFDEIHYISDVSRGHVWEETIMNLNPKIQLIMLSATVSNLNKFQQWIEDLKKKKLILISTDKRIIPLTHYLYSEEIDDEYKSFKYELVQIMDNELNLNKNNLQACIKKYRFQVSNLNKILTNFKNEQRLPALFFCFSRYMCEQYANSININLLSEFEILAGRKRTLSDFFQSARLRRVR